MSDKRKLGEALIEEGLLSEVELTAALGEQARWGHRLGETLVQMGFVEETDLVRMLSRRFGFPGVDLRDKTIEAHVLDLLPSPVAHKYSCLPLFLKREGTTELLFLGMEDPSNLAAIDEVSFRTGFGVRPVIVGPVQMRRALEAYYGSGSSTAGARAPITEAPLVAGETAPMVPRGSLGKAREDDLVGSLRGPDDWAFDGGLERQIDPSEFDGSGPEAPGPEAAPDHKPREVPTRQILQALVRVLIERGLLSREELLATVHEIQGREPS